jgi:hypothetical protein
MQHTSGSQVVGVKGDSGGAFEHPESATESGDGDAFLRLSRHRPKS